MTKSIEEQASEKYPHTVVVRSGLELRDSLKNREFREVYIDAAKSRDIQWSAVVSELRDALKFYKNHADCNSGIIYGTCRCAFCKGDDKHRTILTKADQMLKEMGINL